MALAALLATSGGACAQSQVADDEAHAAKVWPRVLPEVRAQGQAPRGDGLHAAVHAVTVITAEDMARAPASTLGELLATLGNLGLSSLTGSDKKASIDLRGMGPTAASSVLIVVDGVPLNDNDQTGADLSGLALSALQRIEIERGGGSVEHGSGAVAGVIRISTLPVLDEGEHRLRLRARLNGDSDRGWDLQAQRRWGAVSAAVGWDRVQNRGHRVNAFENKTLADLALRWQGMGTGLVDAHFKHQRQRDAYGLPGPVSREAFEGSGAQRRASSQPLDGGRTEADRTTLGAAWHWGDWGRTEWRSSERQRFSPFWASPNPAQPVDEQADVIDTMQQDHRLSHRFDVAALGRVHSLTVGWQRMRGELSRSQGVLNRLGSELYPGRADSVGRFLSTTLRPTDALTVQAGVRWNHFRTQRVTQRFERACLSQGTVFIPGVGSVPFCAVQGDAAYRDSGPALARRWFNHATELGLNWRLGPEASAFVSHSRTFRAPNLDDLALASATLRPQDGRTTELGLRQRLGAGLQWSVTVFHTEIDDEIFFAQDELANQRVNRNLAGRTRRTGAELGAQVQLPEGWRLQGQFTHLRPRLAGQAMDIPLVARNTASGLVTWQASERWRWSLSARLVGPREDGNASESPGVYRRLPAHDVWDLAVHHQAGDWAWRLGVRNLFNRVYSSTGYSETYYPMPGRQAHLALSWSL